MLVAFAPVAHQGLVLVPLGGFRVGTPVGPGITLMAGLRICQLTILLVLSTPTALRTRFLVLSFTTNTLLTILALIILRFC